MRRSWMAAAVAALSLALGAVVARAQTAPTRYVFVTVDAVAAQTDRLWVTGIVQGEVVAREVQILFSSTPDYGATATWTQTCERKALLAMAKPGQYLFEASSLNTYVPVCKLTRVNP